MYSFWLRLFARYAAYHMQLLAHTRYSRKFIVKSSSGPKILQMSQNHGSLCFGDVFCGVFGGFSRAARTAVYQIEFLKRLVELVSKSNSTFQRTLGNTEQKIWTKISYTIWVVFRP